MTYGDWFKKYLPEEVAEAALDNMNKQINRNSGQYFLCNHEDVISTAFQWERTPEGREFWSKWAETIREKKRV